METYRHRAARGAAVTRALKRAGFVITDITQYEGVHVSASGVGRRVDVSCDVVGSNRRAGLIEQAIEVLQAAGYTTTEPKTDSGITSFYATKG